MFKKIMTYLSLSLIAIAIPQKISAMENPLITLGEYPNTPISLSMPNDILSKIVMKLRNRIEVPSTDIQMLIQYCKNEAGIRRVAELLSEFTLSDMGCSIIQDILLKFPNTGEIFAQKILSEYNKFITPKHGLYIFAFIWAHCSDDLVMKFIQPTLTSLSQLTSNEFGGSVVQTLVHRFPQTAELFANWMYQNFDTIFKNKNNAPETKLEWTEAYYEVLKNCSDKTLKQFEFLIVNYTGKHQNSLMYDSVAGMRIIELMARKIPTNKILTTWFHQLKTHAQREYYAHRFLRPINNPAATQTNIHLQHNLITIGFLMKERPRDCDDSLKKYFERDLNNVLDTIHEKELSLQNNYYTFIHGQRRACYLPEKLYTLLWSMKYKNPINDFLFTHIKEIPITVEKINEQARIKNLLLQNGRYDLESRNFILFMNYALFANVTRPGSNSADYIVRNTNSPGGNQVTVSLSDACKKLGYENIYMQFKTELEDLEREYTSINSYGTLLTIAIPKEKIQQYAYVSKTGGAKSFLYIDGIGHTNDIRIIMETLRHQPEKIRDTDALEFCLIMTHKDGGLDPATGIKVFATNPGDLAKLKELQTKEDALFSKIKAAIEQDGNAKAQDKAVQRAHMLVNHVAANTQPMMSAQAIA